ncbi:hypothetical protein H2202_000071 [Exophiala xenobiotica]|nr:hypothetical protein H2202_000071 [Exophiala xenobiotica]
MYDPAWLREVFKFAGEAIMWDKCSEKVDDESDAEVNAILMRHDTTVTNTLDDASSPIIDIDEMELPDLGETDARNGRDAPHTMVNEAMPRPANEPIPTGLPTQMDAPMTEPVAPEERSRRAMLGVESST